MRFCQRFLPFMLKNGREKKRKLTTYAIQSNYKFTNIPLKVAFKMLFLSLFCLFFRESLNISHIYKTLDRIVFTSSSPSSAQQVTKARAKHFSSRFSNRNSSKPSVKIYDEYFMFSLYLSFENKLFSLPSSR